MTGIPLDVDKLSALDQLSAEMGFDRAELLTLTRRLLFVEGRADQTVLEALFGAELRRCGTRVIRMQGTGAATPRDRCRGAVSGHRGADPRPAR